MSSLHRTPDYAAGAAIGPPNPTLRTNINSTDLRLCHLYWLETADGFQTFDQKTEAELEQEIQEVRALLAEEDDEESQC